METLGIGFVVLCIVIVLLKAYFPLFARDNKTFLFSDDELLLAFYDGIPLKLDVFVSRVDAMYGVLPSSSELSTRCKTLIDKKKLKKVEILDAPNIVYGGDTNELPRKIVLYSRI